MKMSESSVIIYAISLGFKVTEYPGDNYLQGSIEGCEPFETISPFQRKNDWRSIEPEFLDAQANALSFFSEGALRFFLPAFLVADLNNKLIHADPTTFDYARFRLSVFTREESGAIVSYLEYKKDSAAQDLTKKEIDAALSLFWLKRGQSAPSAKRLEARTMEEADYFAAISDFRAS